MDGHLRIACALLACACALPCASAEALPDPTRPPDVRSDSPADPSMETLAVQSILVAPHRRQAIINGQVVHIGDKVGTAQVADIREDRVMLRNGNATETLFLYSARRQVEVTGGAEKQQQGKGREGRQP